MTNDTTSEGRLAALAGQAATVAAELARLQELWDEAERDAPPNIPRPEVTFAQGYPFGSALEEVVVGAADWSRHLQTVADSASDRLAAAALAIRLHLDRLDAVVDRLDETSGEAYLMYEGMMRGGVGGVWGDIGAAFNTEVQLRLASLLDAIGDEDMDTVRERADDLSRVYLDARTRDDQKH
jgi:hypothetical protein